MQMQVIARFYDNALGRMFYEDSIHEIGEGEYERYVGLGVIGGERPKAMLLGAPPPTRRGPVVPKVPKVPKATGPVAGNAPGPAPDADVDPDADDGDLEPGNVPGPTVEA